MNDVVTPLRVPSETVESVTGVIIGVVVGENDDEMPLVRWAKGRNKAVPARAVWMGERPKWSACVGLRAVLAFEDDDESKPILLGLLDPPPVVAEVSAESLTEPTKVTKPKVLRIESEQELILECGKAKIALRADGRVHVLGGYVLSKSSGVNKIKGGSVQIN